MKEGLTILVAPLVPSLQVTVPAQFETVKVAELPAHILGLLTVGVGLVHKQLVGAV